jgi:hypothetical protein
LDNLHMLLPYVRSIVELVLIYKRRLRNANYNKVR